MTPSASDHELLARLRGRGARLEVDDDGTLWVRRGTPGALTDELATQLGERKAAIVNLLQREERAITWRVKAMQEQVDGSGKLIGELIARPGAEIKPGHCRSCAEEMPAEQTGKCMLCGLAALRALNRVAEAQETTP